MTLSATVGAIRTILIQITPEDFRQGKPSENDACPIALVLHRVIPGVDFVDVDGTTARYGWIDGPSYAADLPDVAEEFVNWFDNHLDGQLAWEEWTEEHGSDLPEFLITPHLETFP
jgi:hypothetical protein